MESADNKTVKPAAGFDYYRNNVYWNDFEQVCAVHNLIISGRADVDWTRHLKHAYGSFDHAFFVNCGNGWVERDLFRLGAINRATGSDISEGLLDQARAGAVEIGLPATYVAADVNTFDPGDATYDLIVNVGAMHHVAYLDRMTRLLAKMLGKNGIYTAFDYVGAHRNQYSWEMWSRVIEINEGLPERFRVELFYPHFATMISTDPSEAVHSELQVEYLKRYFDIEQFTPLGGCIAYSLLYQNGALYAERHEPEGAAIIEKIMAADRAYLAERPEDNLFAFWIARPKITPPNPATLARWDNEERAREEKALLYGGRYYPIGALELIYGRFAALRDAHLRELPSDEKPLDGVPEAVEEAAMGEAEGA